MQPVVAKMLQPWVTAFVAVVIVIIAGDVVARFAVTVAASVVVLTVVAKVAATVATNVAAVVIRMLQQ